MSLPVLLQKLQKQKKKKSQGDTPISSTDKSTVTSRYLKNIKMSGSSSSSSSVASDVQVAPLRGLDDFLLESARFQVPNFRDPDKWANRLFNNLLYYQTNYFLTALIVFTGVGVMHPIKMFYGFMAMAVALALFYYITNDRRPAEKFKRNHPLISVVVILFGGYFIVYMLGSVVVFLMGIMLPLVVIFFHASMRLRNIKNKITNKLETVGFQRTPMGIFLGLLGQEPEMWS